MEFIRFLKFVVPLTCLGAGVGALLPNQFFRLALLQIGRIEAIPIDGIRETPLAALAEVSTAIQFDASTRSFFQAHVDSVRVLNNDTQLVRLRVVGDSDVLVLQELERVLKGVNRQFENHLEMAKEYYRQQWRSSGEALKANHELLSRFKGFLQQTTGSALLTLKGLDLLFMQQRSQELRRGQLERALRSALPFRYLETGPAATLGLSRGLAGGGYGFLIGLFLFSLTLLPKTIRQFTAPKPTVLEALQEGSFNEVGWHELVRFFARHGSTFLVMIGVGGTLGVLGYLLKPGEWRFQNTIQIPHGSGINSDEVVAFLDIKFRNLPLQGGARFFSLEFRKQQPIPPSADYIVLTLTAVNSMAGETGFQEIQKSLEGRYAVFFRERLRSSKEELEGINRELDGMVLLDRESKRLASKQQNGTASLSDLSRLFLLLDPQIVANTQALSERKAKTELVVSTLSRFPWSFTEKSAKTLGWHVSPIGKNIFLGLLTGILAGIFVVYFQMMREQTLKLGESGA